MSVRKGIPGVWYCAEHRPEKPAPEKIEPLAPKVAGQGKLF